VPAFYDETFRPQFHFTARHNWLNDPNGLVYYRGEYHLFFQHNPFGTEWGNMTWGHAVSRDLVHWQQLPNALEPDPLGTVFSGCAVVDAEDTAGFRRGREKPIIAIYTAAGGTSPESQGQPFTQCLAYSNDRGRTWLKYAGNPVLPHVRGENRDPKVVWHVPTRRWIMALYLDGNDFALFSAPDLKQWTHLHNLTMPGCNECPDLFEMPIEEPHGSAGAGKRPIQNPKSKIQNPTAHKWVFTAANGRYLVGEFDGQRFTPETGPLPSDYGTNFYAAQTYSNIPPADGRRIQIAWMRGGTYPDMPFNQHLSVPCALTLRRTPAGLRLYRQPVRELSVLSTNERTWRNLPVGPAVNANLLAGLTGELWDIEVTLEPGSAVAFGLRVRGQEISYSVTDRTLSCPGCIAPLELEGDRIRLRALVDRTSLEVYGNDGAVSLTSCFLPPEQDRSVAFYAVGGVAKLLSMKVRQMRSSWKPDRAE
jgi:sucrose-6-phosphate hydrolase SacC (GH32 family)